MHHTNPSRRNWGQSKERNETKISNRTSRQSCTAEGAKERDQQHRQILHYNTFAHYAGILPGSRRFSSLKMPAYYPHRARRRRRSRCWWQEIGVKLHRQKNGAGLGYRGGGGQWSEPPTTPGGNSDLSDHSSLQWLHTKLFPTPL